MPIAKAGDVKTSPEAAVVTELMLDSGARAAAAEAPVIPRSPPRERLLDLAYEWECRPDSCRGSYPEAYADRDATRRTYERCAEELRAALEIEQPDKPDTQTGD